MTGLDGAPLPPIEDAPPFPLGAFLALSIGVALLVALVWFVAVRYEIRREETREQTKRVGQRAIEQHREALTQWLIDNSPGGRKPWQDRRGG